MLKPNGGAILPDDKQYFNYSNSHARLVTEEAFGRLKIRFRILFLKCESNKETVKLYGLAWVLPHNLCTERSDLAPRNFDLPLDHASNGRLSREEARDALALRSTNKKNSEVNKKFQALKVRKALTGKMWDEKEDSL